MKIYDTNTETHGYHTSVASTNVYAADTESQEHVCVVQHMTSEGTREERPRKRREHDGLEDRWKLLKKEKQGLRTMWL